MTKETNSLIERRLTASQVHHLESAPFAEVQGDGRTIRSLIQRGLVERGGTVPNRQMPAWPLPAIRLTALGHTTLQQTKESGK